MYVLHFYATTHTDWLRSTLQSCLNQMNKSGAYHYTSVMVFLAASIIPYPA